jgi:hypothetical protein
VITNTEGGGINGLSKVKAVNGLLTLHEFFAKKTPSEVITLEFHSEQISHDVYEAVTGEVYEDQKVDFTMEECVVGEKEEDNACEVCPNKMY